MRLVSPTVNSNGLGNNIMALAKAHLIAQTCQMEYLSPLWPACEHVKPPTPNGYGYYFPSSAQERRKLKFIDVYRRVERRLPVRPWPVVTFGRNEYHQMGVEDAGESCLAYLKTRGLDDPAKSAVVTVAPGIVWGGYSSIRRARHWLMELLLSHKPTAQRFTEIEQRLAGRLRVALHVRMNDFANLSMEQARATGERNVRLPLEWYARICRQLREVGDCEFVLVTDGKPEEVEPLLREFNPVHILGEPYQDLLSVLLIAKADLVVCSNSTYSRMACFLNDKPYIWCANMLYPDDSGRYGYLWEDRGQPVPAEDRSAPEAIRRCSAIDVNFSEVPEGVKRYVASHGKAPIEVADDLLYRDPVYLLP